MKNENGFDRPAVGGDHVMDRSKVFDYKSSSEIKIRKIITAFCYYHFLLVTSMISFRDMVISSFAITSQKAEFRVIRTI
jgi:hypothetical protein